ncbi:MAG: Obg family GTPase CgtA, partial [Oscillospiraceae bacterium]|nr:Obg family GTPase CgtA [Oscillospiraceae bacterium]
YIAEKGLPFYVISAAAAQGTKPLLDEIAKTLETLPPVKRFEPEEAPEEAPEEQERYTIEIDADGVYQVKAPFMEPIMRVINPDDWSSLQYFERVLRTSGIIDKLEEMGAKEGVTVSINGFEFDYVD